jgi:hypothetical protein
MKLAILIVLCQLSVAHARMRRVPTKAESARIVVKKYAYEAFPQWAVSHPDNACPAKIADLDEFMLPAETKDPWGHVYVMSCGATLPKGAKGVAVMSTGPDGKAGTADDIKSWE